MRARDLPRPADGLETLRLRSFGVASLDLIDATGASVDHQETSKALALVIYLACSPTRSASREHLIDLLWSDLETDAAKHALRQHLWHLRRRFGDVVLTDRRNVVRLGDGLDFDRHDLLAAAEQAHCERVVELYRGEFFPDFAAPGSNEFERWSDVERARLRDVFIRCAEQLVRQWLSSGRSRDGQALARRVRDTEPMAQHGWRLLIEAHISGRDDLGAQVEADAFERHLADEEIEAEPASRALIAAARRGTSQQPAESKGPFSELVGREAEFAWLVDAWSAAAGGRASGVHIVAPAGFGKSRLLQEFRARLASLRARVVVVRADAGSRSIPLSLASDLVIAIGELPGAGGVTPEAAATLVGLAPALASTYPAVQTSRSGPADEPHARRAAIRDLLAAVAEDRPLAVLIDDFHWSDRESASMLAGAFGALAKQRLLIVVAQRPTDAATSAFIVAKQFTLAPLSESAIAALLASIASLPAAKWCGTLPDELRRATGGSPLLVVETLQLALQRDVLVVTNGEWRCADPRALNELLRAGGAVQQRLLGLSDADRTIVSLLSMAKTALPLDVLANASHQPANDLGDRLAALERSGLVVQAQSGWQIGHDEYASAALSNLPAADARSLHAALGYALIESNDSTGRLRRLAPNQLRLGDAWDRLRLLFSATVTESARRGERRTLTGLASEFLGDEATEVDAERLVALLPLDVRVGLVTPRRKAAALTFALAAPGLAALFAFTPARNVAVTPDYVALIGFSDGAGGLTLHELPMTEQALRTDSALVLTPSTHRPIRLRSMYGNIAAPSPANPDEWLSVRAMTDSGITDIFLTNTRDGSVQRLTDAAADDTDPVWSPDGKSVVFASDRWSDVGHQSLALLDLRTRQIRRLTTSDDIDIGSRWSPDGSRIAFARRHADGTQALCTVTVDASDTQCRSLSAGGAPIGWLSDSVTLVARQADGQVALSRVNVDTGFEWTAGVLPRMPSLSADGHWMLCDCRAIGEKNPALVVIHSDDLTIRRRIAIEGRSSEPTKLLWRESRTGKYIASVVLEKGAGQPIVNVPYQLLTVARDKSGGPRSMPVRTFTVSDTSIAAISEDGTLVGHRAGSVTAHVSVGGWQRDSLRLTIRNNRRETLFAERWQRELEPTWITFGEPRPIITTERTGARAFLTNGDGRFHSGAVTGADYAASNGLSLSTSISTPITFSQWQELELEMNLAVDTAAVGRWNSRAGYIWTYERVTEPNARCGFKYPSGPEGIRYGDSFKVHGGDYSVIDSASVAMRTGRRTRLNLQLFPDGRCGLAIDGVAIAIIGAPVPRTSSLPARARLIVMGNSYRTQVLIGPITLQEGVDTTIDWSRARRAPSRSLATSTSVNAKGSIVDLPRRP